MSACTCFDKIKQKKSKVELFVIGYQGVTKKFDSFLIERNLGIEQTEEKTIGPIVPNLTQNIAV